MSYCRFSLQSDVYVYAAEDGFHCAGCTTLSTAAEMLDHLIEHRNEGFVVPDEAVNRLRREVRMNEKDEKFLAKRGWATVCMSPLELEHEDGSKATLNAAKMVLSMLRHEQREQREYYRQRAMLKKASQK